VPGSSALDLGLGGCVWIPTVCHFLSLGWYLVTRSAVRRQTNSPLLPPHSRAHLLSLKLSMSRSHIPAIHHFSPVIHRLKILFTYPLQTIFFVSSADSMIFFQLFLLSIPLPLTRSLQRMSSGICFSGTYLWIWFVSSPPATILPCTTSLHFVSIHGIFISDACLITRFYSSANELISRVHSKFVHAALPLRCTERLPALSRQ
jgi:hypothetical protein